MKRNTPDAFLATMGLATMGLTIMGSGFNEEGTKGDLPRADFSDPGRRLGQG